MLKYWATNLTSSDKAKQMRPHGIPWGQIGGNMVILYLASCVIVLFMTGSKGFTLTETILPVIMCSTVAIISTIERKNK